MSSGPYLRKPDWPTRLEVEINRPARFRWGSRDCVLFACNCVRAMTGEDPAAPWRGSYTTKAGAMAIIDQHRGLLRLVTKGLKGCPVVPAGKAQRGDFVLLQAAEEFIEGGRAAAIIGLNGSPVMLGRGRLGLIEQPLESVIRAWRI